MSDSVPPALSSPRKMQSQSFKPTAVLSSINSDLFCSSHSQFYNRGDDDGGRSSMRLGDFGDLERSTGNAFYHIDAVNLSATSDSGGFKASNLTVFSNNLQFDGLTNTNSLGSDEIGSSGIMGFEGGRTESLSNGHIKNWEDSLMAPQHRLQTDTSINSNSKNQFPGVQHKYSTPKGSIDSLKVFVEKKALHRQAQNRETAKKSRMRRKAYVQQLEDSQAKLTKMEQDLKRARTQGSFTSPGISVELSHSIGGSAFDIDYTRWVNEHQQLISYLRSALNSQVTDDEVQIHVNNVMLHYTEVFCLKRSGAKSDVFHILSGMWKTPAERCFMWLGGFRSSEILKVLQKQIEPLTEQQLVGIRNLHHSSQQAEDALNQGMEALQQSLVQVLSSSSLNTENADNGGVTEYMEQMTAAMSTLATLGNFLHQADLLRLRMLEQLQKILTTRQAARALLAFNDYNSRIRALSSLWVARPRK